MSLCSSLRPDGGELSLSLSAPAPAELSGEQEAPLAAEWPGESQLQDPGLRCVTSGRGCGGQLLFSQKVELEWETAGLFAASQEVVLGNPRSPLALLLWLLPLSRAMARADCPQRAVVYNRDTTGHRGEWDVRSPRPLPRAAGPSLSGQDVGEANPLPSGKASGPV